MSPSEEKDAGPREADELAEVARAAARHDVAELIGRAGGLRKLVDLAWRIRSAEEGAPEDEIRHRPPP